MTEERQPRRRGRRPTGRLVAPCNLYLPHALRDRLERYATARGLTNSEVAREALVGYLDAKESKEERQ